MNERKVNYGAKVLRESALAIIEKINENKEQIIASFRESGQVDENVPDHAIINSVIGATTEDALQIWQVTHSLLMRRKPEVLDTLLKHFRDGVEKMHEVEKRNGIDLF